MSKTTLRVKGTGKICPHLDQVKVNNSKIPKCQECGTAENLRLCVTCGHVGCCESDNAHAKLHSEKTGHPIIRQMPVTSMSFVWCYGCGDYLV